MKKMKEGKLPVTKIAAAIFCERTGQKAILIGKQGEMLKRIGTAARKDIESLLGTRVFLELFVKVQEEWRSSRGFVEDLDWRRQLGQIAEKQAGGELRRGGGLSFYLGFGSAVHLLGRRRSGR